MILKCCSEFVLWIAFEIDHLIWRSDGNFIALRNKHKDVTNLPKWVQIGEIAEEQYEILDEVNLSGFDLCLLCPPPHSLPPKSLPVSCSDNWHDSGTSVKS